MRELFIGLDGYLLHMAISFLTEHANELNDQNFFVILIAMLLVLYNATIIMCVLLEIIFKTWNIYSKKKKLIKHLNNVLEIMREENHIK